MLKHYQRSVGWVFRLMDVAVIALFWLAAFEVRFHTPLLEVTKGFPEKTDYLALMPGVVLVWGLVFESLGVYGSRRILRRVDEALLLLKAHTLSFLIFLSFLFLVTGHTYSRAVLLLFLGLSGAGLLSFRLALRSILRFLRRRGHNLRTVVIVGRGALADTVAELIQAYPDLGLRIVGRVEAQGEGNICLKDLDRFLEKHPPDQVILAILHEDYAHLEPVLRLLKAYAVELMLVPEVYAHLTLGCTVEDFEGLPVVHLNGSPLDGSKWVLKRSLDAITASLLLLVLSPLFGLIALLIRLSSRGPIFYKQERMGLDGKTFHMFKFRSMVAHAEEASGAVWAKKHDSRRTPLGCFLRATNLDELPQLVNVIRGDMSLVGPRPERPCFVEEFRKIIPGYMLRHRVKAGMTGWAQVNGWRGQTSLSKRVEYDIYYIRHWSFLFDVKILLLTLWKGFRDDNAY
jgi:Undecaprenyl-phosphate glucose phosphotransferase